MNSSLTIQPVGSFQLVHRSPDAPASASFARTAAPKVGCTSGSSSRAEQHGHGERLPDDVLALGEHGAFEAGDVLDARAEQRRDLFGRQPGADVRLDLARARADRLRVALAFSARLAQLDAQHVVDGERESLARLGRQDEHFVLGSDDFELFHANAPPILRCAPMLTQRVALDREYPARAASFTATQDTEPRTRICEIGFRSCKLSPPDRVSAHCYSRKLRRLRMATDYDAPRKTEDDSESIEALKERVPDKLSGSVDVEDADNPSGFELPGADLSDLELDVVVLPPQEDEFTCVELLPREAPLAARPRGRRRPYLLGVRRVACARRSAAASRSGVRDEITQAGAGSSGSVIVDDHDPVDPAADDVPRPRVQTRALGRGAPRSPVRTAASPRSRRRCARGRRAAPRRARSTTGDAATSSATMPTPTSTPTTSATVVSIGANTRAAIGPATAALTSTHSDGPSRSR